jgi:hypothetical protein
MDSFKIDQTNLTLYVFPTRITISYLRSQPLYLLPPLQPQASVKSLPWITFSFFDRFFPSDIGTRIVVSVQEYTWFSTLVAVQTWLLLLIA